MTDPIDTAQERLDKAAIVLGSKLLDGDEPRWPDVHELEAACVEYVRALRGQAEQKRVAL